MRRKAAWLSAFVGLAGMIVLAPAASGWQAAAYIACAASVLLAVHLVNDASGKRP